MRVVRRQAGNVPLFRLVLLGHKPCTSCYSERKKIALLIWQCLRVKQPSESVNKNANCNSGFNSTPLNLIVGIFHGVVSTLIGIAYY